MLKNYLLMEVIYQKHWEPLAACETVEKEGL